MSWFLPQLTPKKQLKARCYLASAIFLVDYAGNVILCCNDYFSNIIMGNLENESILEIWHKEKFKKLRENLRKGQLDLEMCKKCKNI